jgi:hypothetical protein
MYKPAPVTESGDIARSIAALCRHYRIPRQYVKLEISFSADQATYRLYGKDKGLDYFEEKGATYEQAQLKLNQVLAARFAGKMSAERSIADETALAKGAAQPAVQMATKSQKEDIIRLLNHPLISRQEKTKMLLALNRLSFERAAEAIIKLRGAIEEREYKPTAA